MYSWPITFPRVRMSRTQAIATEGDFPQGGPGMEGAALAHFDQHCKDCEAILGARHEDVNRWLDGLFWKLGPGTGGCAIMSGESGGRASCLAQAVQRRRSCISSGM